MKFSGLSIFICTVNEPEISKVIDGICNTCLSNDIKEINIVCSPKTDTSYFSLLEKSVQEHPDYNIRYFRQTLTGLGGAVYNGYASATGSHVVGTVSDFQLDPADIGRMIEIAKREPEKIITVSRRIDGGSFGKYPALKKFLCSLFNFSARVLMHSKQTDISLPYQCMPTAYFTGHKFNKDYSAIMLETGFLPELDGFSVVEIPTVLRERQTGSSNCGLKYYLILFRGYLRILSEYYKGRHRKE